ncbi:hypothetical protein Henu6_gp201 [Acinetobacter phage Henu6]|uniref:Uncharacterized protein n=1 Tax=Acinetobacter phage Henu6 TaxID=2500136 RepID=A0A410T5S8_9CAUD|nr:hypothetical protein Henu6_gp201 [Acinetobacter phage Henu6]
MILFQKVGIKGVKCLRAYSSKAEQQTHNLKVGISKFPGPTKFKTSWQNWLCGGLQIRVDEGSNPSGVSMGTVSLNSKAADNVVDWRCEHSRYPPNS